MSAQAGEDFASTQRRMCATMLLLQAVIVALSVPVLIQVANVKTPTALALGLGISLGCVLTAGLLRRSSWAYWIGHGLQLATIGLGLLTAPMFGVGILFAVLWFAAFGLGRRIANDKARWAGQ